MIGESSRAEGMNFTLKVWRQKDAKTPGEMVTYPAKNINPEMSFLEMIDVVIDQLELGGIVPIACDSDCSEGICGMCGLVINGRPHGPGSGTTTCQLYMRSFENG